MSGPAERLRHGEVSLVRWDLSMLDDLDAAIDASLPELNEYMPWATPDHGLADTREYIERSLEEWDAGVSWNYAILAPGSEVSGSCGLMTRMGPGVLEIGYWVHSARTGRGYARSTAAALAAEGLRVPGIERVAIKHDVANVASGRVAAAAGFALVGQVEEPVTAPGQTGVLLVWERRA